MTPLKVLITGANGNLAPFVIARLRERYQLTLTSVSEASKTNRDIPFIKADLADYEKVVKSLEGQDVVIHMASVLNNRLELPPTAFADAMVKGTWHIAEGCVRQGVRRLIHVSSILACGQPKDSSEPYRIGDPAGFDKRDLLYPLAKHLAEEILNAYHDAHGLAVIHLRPGVIAGDPRYPAPARPETRMTNQFWFRHVDPRDVAQAIDIAITADREHGCYHLIAGRADSMFDWTTASTELGYRPAHNWPEIPVSLNRFSREG